MHKFRWIVPLILIISLIFLTSACGKSSSNESEPNNANVDNNMDNTMVTPSFAADNKGQTAPAVNGSGGSIDRTINEKILGSDNKQLNEEDFEISYKNIIINRNTEIEEITKKLGFPEDYEANNKGYISGNAKYRRWNLCYPSYNKPEIRIIVLSEREYVGEEVKDGNSYIVGIYLEGHSTNKGLKVGDELEKVLQLYGRPDSFEQDKENAEGLYFLRYSKDDLNLDITLDNDMKKVEYIFVDYNMKKSAEEQQGENN